MQHFNGGGAAVWLSHVVKLYSSGCVPVGNTIQPDPIHALSCQRSFKSGYFQHSPHFKKNTTGYKKTCASMTQA